jgi:hypothetical protein
VLVLIVLAHGPALAQDKPRDGQSTIKAIEVSARAIDHFEKSNSERRRFGKLEFRGGLVLSSPSPDFGGWSGLLVDADGRRLLAISDAGAWMSAEIDYAGTRPKGLKNARLGPIQAMDGRALTRGRDRDAEGLALLDGSLDNGTVLISFERNHRIGRFHIDERGLSAPLGYLKSSPRWKLMKSNRSLEAVGVLKGGPLKGSVIAFAEDFPGADRNHTGWIWVGGIAAQPQDLSLRNIGEFAITDVASLDDGSLIVLERWYKWLEGVKMRLRRIKAADVRPGALLDGEVLFEADLGYEIDNMEGLAVHKGARGETVLTLISDDNFNHFLQRNVLLQFTLIDRELASQQPK